MTRADTCAREVLLALFASQESLTWAEVRERTGRSLDEVEEAVGMLSQRSMIEEKTPDRMRWGLHVQVLGVLEIMARGSAPLDRHLAEALAIREGRTS